MSVSYEDEEYGAYGGDEEHESTFWTKEQEDEDIFVPQEDEVRFESEFNIHGRVGATDMFGEIISSDPENVNLRDPRTRFIQFTRIVFQAMMEKNGIRFKKSDINFIVKQIGFMPNVGYKNPTAFVLGYYVVNPDGTINKKKFNEIIPSLPRLDYPIQQHDVLRYARFWIQTKLYR
ncbi:hypothetical protein [Shrimp hemocyte iridescent virus]|uniref:Uncharacterized protein n=2 Tax=Decapodiridovirus litopenaeus1 TaxID=3428192 RepID=A0A291B0P5_9VIRU|nr:hypothetical protein KM509_gp059 [Shrimp hemocyte iridescent virus]ATE87068.1 hypothetical protein [Shrimp hemocyte iridescent virus]